MTSDEIKKVIFGYNKLDNITEAFTNIVGANVHLTLRTIPALTDLNTKYVAITGDDAGAGDAADPHRTVDFALSELGGAFAYVGIQDDGRYNELLLSGFSTSNEGIIALLGKTPTIEFNFGVRLWTVRTADQGNVYYVNASDPAASDINAGTNPALPLKTIDQGIDNSIDGDTVQVDDNSTYQEALVVPAGFALLIKSKIGFSPTIKFTPNANDAIIYWEPTAAKTLRIEGFILDGNTDSDSVCVRAIVGGAANHTLEVYGCEMKNMKIGIACEGIENIYAWYNRIYDSENSTGAGIANSGISVIGSTAQGTLTSIFYNKIYNIKAYNTSSSENSGMGIYLYGAALSYDVVSIQNNILYDCNSYAVLEDIRDAVAGKSFTFRRNTVFTRTGATSGVFLKHGADWQGGYLIVDDIVNGEATAHFNCGNATAMTYCYSDHSKDTNASYGAGCIDGVDPEFLNTGEGLENLGLKPESIAKRAGNAQNDIGARVFIITLGSQNHTLNGIIFDGHDDALAALMDHTPGGSGNYYWNDFTRFGSSALDLSLPVHAAASDNEVTNNKFYNNGVGLAEYGGSGNVHEYNSFYRNDYIGEYIGGGVTTEHNSYFDNYMGTYVGINAGGLILRNNAYQDNEYYGIYSSNLSFSTTYCCIGGGVNSNVDTSDSSNIFLSPLFRDTDVGEEDLRLRTKAAGFSKDSPCKDAGSSDIGAWQSDITVNAPSFTSFTLLNNPTDFDLPFRKKSTREKFTDSGRYKPFVKFTSRMLEMKWKRNDYSPDAQTDLLEYIANLTTPIKISPFGGDAYVNGNGGVVDAVALTLTDVALSLTPNILQGWWATVQSWDFHIVSNTPTVLTLLDPYGKLSNDTSLPWTVTFLEMLPNVKKQFKGSRPAFFWELNRTGYGMSFIEV